MKLNAFVAAMCLVGCEDPTSMGSGPETPGMGDPKPDPMDPPPGDPRDDPFLSDINNTWVGSLGSDTYLFSFQATPSGKISSAVIRGSVFVQPVGSSFRLDGVYCDHVVHFTATQGANVLTFDGTFIDIARMHLVIRETQAHIILSGPLDPDRLR
jgi:hypothetical protein